MQADGLQDEWADSSDESSDANNFSPDQFYPHPTMEFIDPDEPHPGHSKPLRITLPDGSVVEVPMPPKDPDLLGPKYDDEPEADVAPEDDPTARPAGGDPAADAPDASHPPA